MLAHFSGILVGTSAPPNMKPISMDHVKYIRHRNTEPFRHKYALTHHERKTLIRDAGIHCLVLFEYYLRLASTENTIISDDDAAEYFDWSRDTAKRWRRRLQNTGWVAIEKASLNNGRKVQVYYLGKEEVANAGLKEKPVKVQKPKAPLILG